MASYNLIALPSNDLNDLSIVVNYDGSIDGRSEVIDSYVEKVLKYFRNMDHFSLFSDGELKSYEIFNRVLHDFQRYYHLEAYTLKQLDRYLWLFGKEVFPNRPSVREPNKAGIR